MKQEQVHARGIRFSVDVNGIEAGHAYLYLLKNDLQERPFGLLEDVHVEPTFRGQGVARELLKLVLQEAEKRCYKLIATSRNDGTRESVHEWYRRLGFTDYGTEFRINY